MIPPTHPAISTAQEAELRKKLAEMGLDESAMMEEFGMGEEKEEPQVKPTPPPAQLPKMAGDEADDPAEPDQSGMKHPKPGPAQQTEDDEVSDKDDTSADVSGSVEGSSKDEATDVSLSDEELDSVLNETTLTDEQKAGVKEILQVMGFGPGAIPNILKALGLFEETGQGVQPQPPPPDVKNQEQLNEWYRKQLELDYTEEQKGKLEEMYLRKGREFMPTERLAYRWKTYERERVEKPNHFMYKVQDGDTLSKIANTLEVSVEQLKTWNAPYKGGNDWNYNRLDIGENILFIQEEGKSPKGNVKPLPAVVAELGLASEEGSNYLDIHGYSLDYPDEIGGYTFITRDERGAKDLNPGMLEIFPDNSEGIWNSNNQGGYLVYEEPLEEVISTAFFHFSGVKQSGYSDWRDFVLQTETYHQGLPLPPRARNPLEPDYLNPDLANPEFGKNWADIGYNYLIYKDGTTIEGRDLRARPAHVNPVKVKGKTIGNTGTVGIVFAGYDDSELTEDQIRAATALLNYIQVDAGLTNLKCVAGHGSLNPGSEGVPTAQKIAEQFDKMNYGTGCLE